MKNKTIKTLLLSAIAVVLQVLHCNAAFAVENNQTELTVMMVKFGKVMLGVLIASVVIYVILYIWNAVLKHSKEKHITTDLSLKTPQNTDDAVLFFINKNKLK